MPTPTKYIAVKGDECQCGRRASVRHCPSCGSVRIYARQNRLHKLIDGTEKWVAIEYRCQACGHLFIEEDREFCDAPPVGPQLAALKVKAIHEASKTGEYLNPSDTKIAQALDELLVETHKEFSDTELRNLDFAFRRVWVDERMKAKANGQKFDENVYDFVIRMLKEHTYGEAVVQRIKEMHERDKSNEQSNSSTVGS
jgi:predicted RNA-binding Zn-ribbon protein involved in translation (DUF1610 family)